MSRWLLFKELIWHPWKLRVSIFIGILGIYDLISGQFIARSLQDKMPIIADIPSLIGWPLWAWIIIWLVFIIIFLFEGAYQYVMRFEEAPQLVKLSVLRTSGTALRNHGQTILSPESVDKWVSQYYEWENDVLENLSALSPTKAELWRTLDTYTAMTLSNPVNPKHKKYYVLFSAKLKRLKTDIDEINTWMRLKNNNKTPSTQVRQILLS